MIGTTEEESWISLQASQSWWRLELPHRSTIARVVIHIPTFTSETDVKRSFMNGFTVYIGDSPVGNGSINARCGKPWTARKVTVIEIICTGDPLVGRYLFVAAADRKKARLYLTEIYVYGCEGYGVRLFNFLLCNCNFPLLTVPDIVISRSVSKHVRKSFNLTCEATEPGCDVTGVGWSSPDGIKVNTILKHTSRHRLVSTLVVNASSIEGNYTCTIIYSGGSARRDYEYTG